MLAQKSTLKVNRVEKMAVTYMCKASNSLSNQVMYKLNEYFESTGKMMSYVEMDKFIKNDLRISSVSGEVNNHNYRNLPANAAQQTIKTVYGDYLSYYKKRKKDKRAKKPKYKTKNQMFMLRYAIGIFKYMPETHSVRLPIAPKIKEKLGMDEKSFLYVQLPPHVEGDKIHEVRIIPNNVLKTFDSIVAYDGKPEEQVKGDEVMGIDLGVNNFASGITSKGTAFLFSGKKIKSNNHFFNKEKAKCDKVHKSVNKYRGPKGYNHQTKRIVRIAKKRNNRVNDQIKKMARKLLKIAFNDGVKNVIIGHNKHWKNKSNMSTQSNQNFCQMPHSKFISHAKQLFARHGITVIETNESHTSKCSFLDNEEVKRQENYLGSRTKRGIFKIRDGTRVNADINAAANIIVKGLSQLTTIPIDRIRPGVVKGFMINPIRFKSTNDYGLSYKCSGS